ncbi:hypothetical protein JTE90_014291 [Oedothorax gibbosus]|uniref:SAM domain-containing protein n=1 Tax=Oedothorax gibbosus TaxID=931172 RepID=A0AAV6TTF4_9ARAC|nr:hypothetical protein JTE90_014291 [Oedothorax gibbosus]
MADEETANLLRSWGLSQDVIEKFRENDIDCRALKELNEDDVSSFFSTLGQRLRFRSGLKSLHPVVQPVVLGIGPDTPFIESLKEFYIYLDTEGEHESTVSALRLLPLLLPVNKPIKTPNKTSYKPSKNDVADSMVIVVKSHADLKNAVAERKHHYAHLKLPFQPVTLTEDTDCISNFMQGDYWRNREKSKDVLTLPLFLFGDDYTCGSVLGSHGTIHKLGAMYVTMPFLPNEFRSALKNIFLLYLYHSSDRKEVKNDKMFAVLIDEFKFLAETGIHVNVPEFTGLVHFSLGLLIGDNLGLHEMAGFAGGFTANHPCRICTISRQEMFTKCDDKSLLLRTCH